MFYLKIRDKMVFLPLHKEPPCKLIGKATTKDHLIHAGLLEYRVYSESIASLVRCRLPVHGWTVAETPAMHDQYPASLGNYLTHHVVYLHVLVWAVISALDLFCFFRGVHQLDLHGIPAKSIQLSSCNCTCMSTDFSILAYLKYMLLFLL